MKFLSYVRIDATRLELSFGSHIQIRPIPFLLFLLFDLTTREGCSISPKNESPYFPHSTENPAYPFAGSRSPLPIRRKRIDRFCHLCPGRHHRFARWNPGEKKKADNGHGTTLGPDCGQVTDCFRFHLPCRTGSCLCLDGYHHPRPGDCGHWIQSAGVFKRNHHFRLKDRQA